MAGNVKKVSWRLRSPYSGDNAKTNVTCITEGGQATGVSSDVAGKAIVPALTIKIQP